MATPRKAALAKTSSASPKKAVHRTSRSKKAGLVFPVAHVRALLRRGETAARVGSSAATYLTAVLEYITTELLEVAGIEQLGPDDDDVECNSNNAVRGLGTAPRKKARKSTGRIGSRTLTLAVASDEELAALLRSVTMSGGGFVAKKHQL